MEFRIDFLKKKGRKSMKQFMNFMKEEDGMGVIEVVLIIIVLIGLASLFKKQVTSLVTSLLSKMTNATKDF